MPVQRLRAEPVRPLTKTRMRSPPCGARVGGLCVVAANGTPLAGIFKFFKECTAAAQQTLKKLKPNVKELFPEQTAKGFLKEEY